MTEQEYLKKMSSLFFPQGGSEACLGLFLLAQAWTSQKQLQGFVGVMTVPHLETSGTMLGTQVSHFFFNTY